MELAGETPQRLWLVESFANSIDVESEQDDLSDSDKFRRWLDKHQHAHIDTQLSHDDLELLRRLRTGLRRILAMHHDSPTNELDPQELNELLRSLTVRVSFDPGGLARIAPDGQSIWSFVTEMVIAVVEASSDGTWQRMKLCAAPSCLVAYYDTSKNHSKRWCSMRTCGNRSKTRNYYHRSTGTTSHALGQSPSDIEHPNQPGPDDERAVGFDT